MKDYTGISVELTRMGIGGEPDQIYIFRALRGYLDAFMDMIDDAVKDPDHPLNFEFGEHIKIQVQNTIDLETVYDKIDNKRDPAD